MSILTFTYTFTAGTTAQSSQVNANFTSVATVVNGNLDNSNLSASAGIVATKLNLTSEFMNLRTTNNRGFSGGVTGDTVPRIAMNSRGTLDFGAGAASAMDISLKRESATILAARDLADSAYVDFKAAALTLSSTSTSTGVRPVTAGTSDIGSTALPWANIYVGTAATDNNKISSAVCTAARTFTLPDADSNSVIPDAGSSNNFLTGITSGGVVTKAQPAFSNLSGVGTIAQGCTNNGSLGVSAVGIYNGDGSKMVQTTASASQSWRVNAGGTAVEAYTPAVAVTRFTSSAITASNAGGGTQAHGLGATPKKIWVMMKCITTDAGYAVNDFVNFYQSAYQSYGIQIGADGTNVMYRFENYAAPIYIVHKTTGASTVIALAKWEFYIYAEL